MIQDVDVERLTARTSWSAPSTCPFTPSFVRARARVDERGILEFLRGLPEPLFGDRPVDREIEKTCERSA